MATSRRSTTSTTATRAAATRTAATRTAATRTAATRLAAATDWTTSTALVAWCVTCGTDVEFATPYGLAPEDLAADEHACVWCGEALLVTVALGAILGGTSSHAA